MWIDSHAHLADKDRCALDACLSAAAYQNVHCILNNATDVESAKKVVNQCSFGSVKLYAAVGVSPFDCLTTPAAWEQELASLCQKQGVIAIGEIGLDNSNPRYPPLENQVPLLEQQLQIARESGLPAILHSRGAERTVIDICKKMNVTKALFHCFTGSKEDLRFLLDQGYYVSYSGIITFRKNNLGEMVRFTPLDRMCIETDTPYLAPSPYRGKPNEPAYLPIVGKKVAELKNTSEIEIAHALSNTFADLFSVSALE